MCPGGEILDLVSGFWRVGNYSDNILECKIIPKNC